MTITCNLTDADYRAFRRHVMFRYRKIHWLYGALLVLILSLTWFGGKPEETVTDKIYLLIGSAFIFGGLTAAFLFVRWLVGRFTSTRFRGPTGQHIFEISDDGLTESSFNGKVETRLTAIRRVDETSQHFFCYQFSGYWARYSQARVTEHRCTTSFTVESHERCGLTAVASGAPRGRRR